MQRKGWTAEEDRVLKYLHEDCNETKWSVIAKKMEEQFNLTGKSGKQCRERYHNHLDSNITTHDWTAQEEYILFDCQRKFGNKWAVISTYLPGRPDNTIKNHFYSKLRKALRKFNKTLTRLFPKEASEFKMATLYKIIEGLEQHTRMEPSKRLEIPTKSGLPLEQAQSTLCNQIKDGLLYYDSNQSQISMETQQQFVLQLHEKICSFENKMKAVSKRRRRSQDEEEQFTYLLPPKSQQESSRSLRGNDTNSFSDYSSYNGGSQLSEMQVEEEPQIPTRGRAKSSSEHNRKEECTEDQRQSMGAKKEYMPNASVSFKRLPTTTEPSLSYSQSGFALREVNEEMSEEVFQESEALMLDEDTGKINMFQEQVNFNVRVISPRISTQERLETQGISLFEPQNPFFSSRIEEE